jgi:hypothetical protein
MGVFVDCIIRVHAIDRIFYLEKHQQPILQQCVFHLRNIIAVGATSCQYHDCDECAIAKLIINFLFNFSYHTRNSFIQIFRQTHSFGGEQKWSFKLATWRSLTHLVVFLFV